MRAVAWDTWAFLESALEGSRRDDVEALLEEADYIFTVRDVVAETFNFLCRRTRRTEVAWEWWQSLRAGVVRIFDPSLDEVHAFIAGAPRGSDLSFTDYSLAWAAAKNRAQEIATEDRAFEALKMRPLFAHR